MANFLDFLNVHRGGILILLLSLLVLNMMVQWLAWIFALGRYSGSSSQPREQTLSYVMADAVVKIINDFRHLLALIIVLIFALALAYAMVQGRETIADMQEALQTVVATLGGLVGSIIGYYFGESAVAKAQEAGQTGDISPSGIPPQAVQGLTEQPTITPAPPPPDNNATSP